jgi:peptidylprolyl isomerase
MFKIFFFLTFLSSPLFASGIVISVDGEANGESVIDLFEDIAPRHVERITTLASDGLYNGVVFHRVIKGFMAQTGDVKFGKSTGDLLMVGMGGSELPNLDQEFSDLNYDRGIVGMARSQDPDSANSQFFIMFDEGSFLNGQYTVIGKVINGLDVLDSIKIGEGANGTILGSPDVMRTVKVIK